MLGLTTWGAKSGVGTHLTLELGGTRVTGRGHKRGQWSIWIAGAPWRIIHDGRLVVGSGCDTIDPQRLEILNAQVLIRLDLQEPAFGAAFEFSNQLLLEVFLDCPCDAGELVVMSKSESYTMTGNGLVSYERSNHYR